MLPDYVINRVEKIAQSEGFTNYKIETKEGSAHGDNFLGVMTAITVSGRKNGKIQSEELHLLCKAPPKNEIRQKNFYISTVFEREIYSYSKLLPAFVRFQKEKGLSEADSFLSFPKVYQSEVNDEKDPQILIMEDLRPKNYEMWPKEKTIDFEHETLVMQELAKYHAVSFAMKDQRPNEFSEFKKLSDLFVSMFVNNTIKSFIKTLLDRSIEALEKPEHKQVMKNFRDNYLERSNKLKSEPYCDEFGIITHGDCWNNNFLFQHTADNKKQLKSICLVDWQLTHYSPPVIDVLYNIFSSTDKPFRDLHYEKLLQTYYSSLSETIRKLGSDPDKLYSYENFRMQMKKYSDYALLLVPLIITIRVAQAKDVSNLDDFAESLERGDENAAFVNKFDGDTLIEFSKQINGFVADLVDYGYVECE